MNDFSTFCSPILVYIGCDCVKSGNNTVKTWKKTKWNEKKCLSSFDCFQCLYTNEQYNNNNKKKKKIEINKHEKLERGGGSSSGGCSFACVFWGKNVFD